MARRVSSRDDVYLSALDLWSLLLFTFLALAFLVRHGADREDQLPMPLVKGARMQQDRSDDRVLFVHWNSKQDIDGERGRLCVVAVRDGSRDAAEERTDVPCWPGAFEGGQSLPLSPRLVAAAEQQSRIIVSCPTTTTSLEACGRLWLLAHEHRFESVAMLIDQN